jgi:hypothetical protein
MSKPKSPAHLADTGKALWSEIVAEYDLRADELRVLASACVAADMEAEFLKAWADLGRPYMSKGSMGQEVEHPLIGSIDKQAKAKAAHLRQLKLPEDGNAGDDAGERSSKARAAANARWSRRGA